MMARLLPFSARLRADRRAVAFLEFALTLPVFLLCTFGALEVTNHMLVRMKVQRLATMTSDMVAQRGASDTRLNEAQLADIMLALDTSATPLDVRKHGRIIITAVVGEDTNADSIADVNRIRWQRFSGGLVTALPALGCRRTSTIAAFSRQLGVSEPIFNVQVSYQYVPLFGNALAQYALKSDIIKQTATFRGRGSVFNDILAVDGYPVRDNCTTATGTD